MHHQWGGMSAGENRKKEKLEHGQARDDKFRHLLSKWHTWLVYHYNDMLLSCTGTDWGCGEGQSYLSQCFAGVWYLSSNRLLISSFIRSVTAHSNRFSRTGCIHVTPAQSQSRFTLHTKVCNTWKCQGILTVLRFDLRPPPKLKQVIMVFSSSSKKNLPDLAATKIELVFYTERIKTDWRFLFNLLIKQIFKLTQTS